MNLILENTDQVPYFTNMRVVFDAACIAPEDYDWYVSDIDINQVPPGFGLDDRWMAGTELSAWLRQYEIQFNWAVFSAVPRGFRSSPASIPHADGNPAYWNGTAPGPRLEGALFEIACWDASATILIHLPEQAARAFVQRYRDARPLVEQTRR